MLPDSIPMPPSDLRRMVGPTDSEAYDNPNGEPIYAKVGLNPDAYESVFDFGCGCGRIARQLLQQNPKPRRYVGIDVHRQMLEWCQTNLTPVDPNFQFFHHDVYAPGYAPRNTLQLAQPFPVPDEGFSLVIANSVFTHLFRRQTEYYLSEVARILKPNGVAITSWFFFDRDSFPFLLTGPFCLFSSEVNPTEAVIYDRRWFIDIVRNLGLGVRSTIPPSVAGHQWYVFLIRRSVDTVDQFPLGEEKAEWLCGASLKPIAKPALSAEVIQKGKVASNDSQAAPQRLQPPALFGTLAELASTRRELEDMKRSWAFRIGRSITAPARMLKRFF
jgi:SAM-dependent methyltransferase